MKLENGAVEKGQLENGWSMERVKGGADLNGCLMSFLGQGGGTTAEPSAGNEAGDNQ